MLGSITSLGERSRGRHWLVTYIWLVLGTIAGGLVLAAGLVGIRFIGDALPSRPRDVLALVGTLIIFYSALRGRKPPSPDRQVDHRWLDRYRGWVIGAGFGFQLGAAVVTRIPAFAIYLLGIAAFLGAPARALIVAGVSYGAVRGLSAAPGGAITTPQDLQRTLKWVSRSERRATLVARSIDVVASGCLMGLIVLS